MSPLQFLTIVVVLLAIAVNVTDGYSQGAWFAALIVTGSLWVAALVVEVRR